MSLEFTFKGNPLNIKKRRTTYFLEYPCETYYECYPIVSRLPRGSYLLEVWGAQGGNSYEYEGGKGGYSSGVLTIQESTNAFFYIGAQGGIANTNESTQFAFNGGGIGKSSINNNATAGGGGTDIRINHDTVYHRVIVAGGGGGSSKFFDTCLGGNGGGVEGTKAAKIQ